MPNGSEMIVQFLEEAGVEYVFGIPGGGTGQIYNLLYGKDATIKTIVCRHEQAAAIMADAYGRATGKPAVIMGQGLFMASNASFGIMEAMLSSSPMVVITETSDGGVAMHPANQSAAGEYGSIDITSIFKTMTKYTTHATNGKEAALGTQLAIKHSTTGRPGPTAVVLRSAAFASEVDVESPPFIHHTSGYLNTAKPQSAPADVEKAVEILSQSRRPVIVAGNGVHISKSHAQLQRLAEMWGAPVATSFKGKSAMDETHPLSLGMAGVYGQDVANKLVGEADTVVVVGAKLTPQDTVRERPNIFNPHQQKIIQIDIDDRNAGWTFPIDLGLIGDAGSILDQLVAASEDAAAGTAANRRQWTDGVAGHKQANGFYDSPEMHQDSSPVLPQRMVSIMQQTLDPSSVFTLDAGNNRTWMAHFYKSRQANTFYCPGGTAGMGWALPAAVALKLVYPDRTVAAVAGDGGYMMTVNALSTALQYELPILCFVFNDNSLGMVRQHQDPDKLIASEFVPTDNAAVARGIGCYGVQVSDSRDLAGAIRDAQASGLPAVIDVLVDRAPSPDDWRADARRAGET